MHRLATFCIVLGLAVFTFIAIEVIVITSVVAYAVLVQP